MCICIYVYTYVYMYVYIYIHIYMCMCKYMFVYVCVCIYIYIYVCVCSVGDRIPCIFCMQLYFITLGIALGLLGDRGSTVVKVLCYKSEDRWLDPS